MAAKKTVNDHVMEYFKLKQLLVIGAISTAFLSMNLFAGTWTPLVNPAPNSISLMLLLPDGSVMANEGDTTNWYRLTPDIHGNYANGTWTTLASMTYSRLYFASDVLKNGKVLVAGGEYGDGGGNSELYDPTSNTWSVTPNPTAGFIDATSTTLPDGDVLVAPVQPGTSGDTLIYHFATDTWSDGGILANGATDQDEAGWVKLPDGSILTNDPFSTTAERYIPSLGSWIPDASLPVVTYSSLDETGPSFLLPNGKAFLLGGTGHTAIYTPSGGTAPGTWVAGPDIPEGLGINDAPSAMMIDGKILCSVGPVSSYNGPTSYFEYDSVSNTFTQINGPTGLTDPASPFTGSMLVLPDGNVLYTDGGSQLYEYSSGGAPLAEGVPIISSITKNSDGSYLLAGTRLTGISQGAAYGDDQQMDSNYPIVKLIDSTGNTYFCRTSNWSSTSVMTGTTPETADFVLPPNLPFGMYQLVVVVNGISSTPADFSNDQLSVGGWTNEDIGTPVVAGSTAVNSAGVWTLTGGGVDIWNTADQFQFASTTMAGNSEMIAKVTSLSTTSNVWAKAGVMVRNDLDADSPFVDMVTTAAKGVSFQWRTFAGKSCGYAEIPSVPAPTTTNPVWVKVVRSGNTFTGFYSLDGVQWIQVGKAQTIVMNADLFSGLAVTSHNPAAACTATFSNVQATAVGLSGVDVGAPSITGNTTQQFNGVYSVFGAGNDIWNNSDQFQFASIPFTGGGDVVAEVTSMTTTNAWAKAGVMIRDSLSVNAPFVDMFATAAEGVSFQWRSRAGGSCGYAQIINIPTPTSANPVWVKVNRSGNTYTGFYSLDGTTWIQVGSPQTFTITSNALAGLEVTSHNAALGCTATFSGVQITPQ